jgi:hypothetical protein
MRQTILNRLNDNISRVRSLIALYKAEAGQHKGRKGIYVTDVLRAATVLLHATLEEFLRGIALWKWPAADENVLNDVPLKNLSTTGRAEKFYLGHLTPFRRLKIQTLIDQSIAQYLDSSSNFNNTNDMSKFLSGVKVGINLVNAKFPELTALMDRRHHIVHQADRNDRAGPGHHRALSLGAGMVERWADAVEEFAGAVLNELPD